MWLLSNVLNEFITIKWANRLKNTSCLCWWGPNFFDLCPDGCGWSSVISHFNLLRVWLCFNHRRHSSANAALLSVWAFLRLFIRGKVRLFFSFFFCRGRLQHRLIFNSGKTLQQYPLSQQRLNYCPIPTDKNFPYCFTPQCTLSAIIPIIKCIFLEKKIPLNVTV